MAMFAERIDARDARAERGGRAHALHRPPRGRRAGAASSRWTGPSELTARQRRGSRSSSPSTTAAAPRSSTRRERFDGRRPRRSSARCLYAPEMHDPDLIIRTSGEQRLSNYLLWQSAYSELVLPRRALARLHPRGVRGVAGRVRGAPAPLRRAADVATARRGAGRRERAPRATARRRRARLGPRRARARRRSRRSPSRSSSSSSGGAGLRARRARRSGIVCLHELYAMLRPRAARSGSPGFARHDRGSCWPPRYGEPVPGRCSSPWPRCPFLFGLVLLGRAPRRRPLAMAATLLGRLLDRPGARARRAAARAAATATAIIIDVLRRHVHRRHRRLLRRPHVRPPPARAGDLAEQDRRGAARSGCVVGDRWRSGSPGSTRTGCRAPTRCCSASPSRSPRRSATCSSRYIKRDVGDEGHRHACSAPTAARWTASTPCSSRSSSATTSGWRRVSAVVLRPHGAPALATLPYAWPVQQLLILGSTGLDRHAGARRRRAHRRARASSGCRAERSLGAAGRAGARATASARIALADADAAARAAEAWTDGEVLAGAEGLVRLVVESGADLVLNALVGVGRPRPDGRDARRGHRPRAGQQGVARRRRRAGDAARRGDRRADHPGRLRALGAAPAARRASGRARSSALVADRLRRPVPRARARRARRRRRVERGARAPDLGRWAARSRSTRRR